MSDNQFQYHPVQVYYEDTDHSGMVYHANYLKFFERAREHYLGVDTLLRLLSEGYGFAVYKLEITYREPARFGDHLVVRSTANCNNEYRLRFRQDVLRDGGNKVLVAGTLDLVCVDREGSLSPLPEEVVQRLGMPE